MGTIRKLIAACALAAVMNAGAAMKLTPQLKVTAEERYDDGLLLPVGDAYGGQLMTKLSPNLGLKLRDETLSSEGWYAADFVARHGSGTMSLDHRGGLDAKKALTERVGMNLQLRLWRVSDPTSLPRLGMAATLAPVFYGQGELAGHYFLSQRWIGRVGYRFEGLRIFDESERTGFMHAPYAETWYSATRRTDVGLQYRFQYFAFGDELAQAHGALAQYRYRLTRTTTFTAKAGPLWYGALGGAGALVPMVNLELQRQGEVLDVGLVAGHDLVGASGFTSALWADYASALVTWRLSNRLRLYALGSYFRNGRPPADGFIPWAPGAAASGYALGTGLEWKISRPVSFQLSLDRIAQIGSTAGAVDLARNIVSARLQVTAF